MSHSAKNITSLFIILLQYSIILSLKRAIKYLTSSTRFIMFFDTHIFPLTEFTTNWESHCIIIRYTSFWITIRIVSHTVKHSVIKMGEFSSLLLLTMMTFEQLSPVIYPIVADFVHCYPGCIRINFYPPFRRWSQRISAERYSWTQFAYL